MKTKLLIIGASGHGKVLVDIAKKMKKWQEIAFLDDNETIKEVMGIKVIGKTNEFIDYINDYDVIVGIGNCLVREKIQKEIEKTNATLSTLIHPNAIIGENVKIGNGTVVMAGTVINCCTNIGNGCIINTGATIDHDCIIEDYVHICPGVNIAGTVKIGKRSWIGLGSKVINNINICNNCILGAGAVVVKDIDEHGLYLGVPVGRVKDVKDTDIS